MRAGACIAAMNTLISCAGLIALPARLSAWQIAAPVGPTAAPGFAGMAMA
jgi:hypothetical protein